MENNNIPTNSSGEKMALQEGKRKRPTALYFCIFCQFVISMGMWIGWDGRALYLQFLFFIFSIFLIRAGHVRLNNDRRNILTWLSFSIASICLFGIVIFRLFTSIFPAFIIIMLNDEDRICCFKYIFKWFAILMIPSIIAWLIYLSVGLPSIGRIWYKREGVQPLWYLLHNNHIFLITYALKETTRFCGYFLEPGHLGMMGAFLLFADGFNFKKRTSWIILLSVFLSFSLTGYVLSFLGYLFVKYERRQIRLKFIIFFGILIIAFYLFSTLYNGGDNYLNEKIISRLEPDEEKGIEGNNRVFGQIDLYFATMFNDWHLILFGYSEETIRFLAQTGSRGTGIEMFIVAHGVIGVLLSFFPYLVYLYLTKNRQYAIFSFVFILLLLLQRSMWYWPAWIICYVYGITLREKQQIESVNVNNTSNET